MMVMLPLRLTGRRITRLVNSEYFSKIWSTGALKNLRKYSALSASPGAAGLAAVGPGAGRAAGLSGAGGPTSPAAFPPGLTFGARFAAGTAGIATTLVFIRAGRFVSPASVLRLASGRLVATPGRSGTAAPAATGGFVGAAAGFVSASGAAPANWVSVWAVTSEKDRSAVFTVLRELVLLRVTVWPNSGRQPV